MPVDGSAFKSKKNEEWFVYPKFGMAYLVNTASYSNCRSLIRAQVGDRGED